jgi:hypothetical protein
MLAVLGGSFLTSPSISTIKRLFAVSANRCAFPGCKLLLVDPSSEVVIGKICHIKARKPGGPRYDLNQTDEERHSFENLLLLCPIHHDIIDADPHFYTVERLIEIKSMYEGESSGEALVSDRIAEALIVTISQSLYQDARALISIPKRHWDQKTSSPAALLRADVDCAVPFHGRIKEMADLEAWCHKDLPVSIRLYTGSGGVGKTRLFVEFCRRLVDEGWLSGFLDSLAAKVLPDRWRQFASLSTPIFVVIDYAEIRRNELVSLLREFSGIRDLKQQVRVVLLARDAGDWWELLKCSSSGVGDLLVGPATSWHRLSPLAIGITERKHSYDLASRTFSEILRKPVLQTVPYNLEGDDFKLTLVLHLAALAAIEGIFVIGAASRELVTNDRSMAKSSGEDQELFDFLLSRERRFWYEGAEANQIAPTLRRGISQAMALITLNGGVNSEKEALSLFAKIPILKDQKMAVLVSLAYLLHSIYPGEMWIEPLAPDLLGEHLVQVELNKDPDALLDIVLGSRSAPSV